MNELNSHLNTHSTEDILQINKCKKCTTFFQSAFNLRLHVLEIHHLVKKFTCSTCSTCAVEFEKEEKASFQKHLELHLANQSANWTNVWQGVCDKGKDVSSYEEIVTSTEAQCDSCEDIFYIKSNLDEHIRCAHSDNEHEPRCPQCDAVFTKLQVPQSTSSNFSPCISFEFFNLLFSATLLISLNIDGS